VFRARDTEYGRDVAVKFVREEVSSAIGLQRFKREIAIAATLSHPHIVPLFDSGEWRGRLYYVMPLVQGQNLQQLLKKEGRLDVERALSIAGDVGEALSYAHSRGVVHRDIKPANIILTDRYAVVADFGVAKALGSWTRDDLTVSEGAVGTPRYMAPEQATDPGRATPRSDIYSFGCVVYEMLTGEPPFPGLKAPGLMAAHLIKVAPSLDSVNPTVPHPIAETVQRVIAKEPEQRFEEAIDFVRALEQGAKGEGHTFHLPSGTPARLWWGAVAAAFLILFVALGYLTPARGWTDGRPESALVMPFATASASPAERAMAVQLAEALTFELSWWDEVRSVASVVQSSAMHDLEIQGPAVTDISQAAAVARRLGVIGAVLVRVVLEPDGESARVEYSLVRPGGRWFGRGSPSTVGAPTVVEAGLDPRGLIDPIVRRLLGLEAVSGELVGRQSGTRSRQALQEYEAGERALATWRLPEAEREFRSALAQDSTFAAAHLRLAQTLYWQLAEDPGGVSEDLGPEVLRASGAARRLALAQEVPERLVRHADAFYSFSTGDYEAARQGYQTMLESDPNDVFAYLLLGSVEYAGVL
jgi:serine/threonine-protein kinase